MELWSDIAGGDIEDNGHSAGMFVGQAHIHAANRTWLPSRKLAAVGHALVKNVDRATPDVQIMKLVLLPT